MEYSALYFGKYLSELSYSDIEHFFKESREESDKIEFKSFHIPDEKNDYEKEIAVIRTICGLLNSEGGLVIWGAPKGQIFQDKKEKVFQGDLSPTNRIIEKDSFISKVTDLITPSPRGIRFQRLIKESQSIYVIEVEQSYYAPHQFRNIYYMRIDGQTKPAPHHYIEALFRKITFPKLEGYVEIDSIIGVTHGFQICISYCIYNKSKLQNEHDIYYRIIFSTGKFQGFFSNGSEDKIYAEQGHELRVLNGKSTLYYNEPLTNSERINISYQDLKENQYSGKLLMFFGGKLSPLMVSDYTLQLDNLNNHHNYPPNSIIVSKIENKYVFERSEQILKNDEEKSNNILGV